MQQALLPLAYPIAIHPCLFFFFFNQKNRLSISFSRLFLEPACCLYGDFERLMLSWYKGTDSAGRTLLSFSFLPWQMPWFLGLKHLITLEVMAERAKSKTTFRFHWAASLALLINFWTYCHGREQNLIWPLFIGFLLCHPGQYSALHENSSGE